MESCYRIDLKWRFSAFLRVLIGLLALWISSVQERALADSAYDPIVAHLEFLGYQCDMVEQGVRARHSSKLHSVISYQKGGILVQTAFPGKEPHQDAFKRHALVNDVNLRTQVSRVAWTTEGHLFMTAWMPGLYDKTRFALFMEAWERDSQILRDMATDLKPYLKE
jgi:hypothetical protein